MNRIMNDHEQKSKAIQYPFPHQWKLTSPKVFVHSVFRPQISVASWEIRHINFLPRVHLKCSPIAILKNMLFRIVSNYRFNSCIPTFSHELIEQTLTYYLEHCKSFSSGRSFQFVRVQSIHYYHSHKKIIQPLQKPTSSSPALNPPCTSSLLVDSVLNCFLPTHTCTPGCIMETSTNSWL